MVPEQRDYVIIEGDRQLAGTSSLQRLRSIHKDGWETLTVGHLVRHNCPHVYPDDTLDDVLEHMADSWLSASPVFDRQTGEFLGAVTSAGT